MTSQDQNNPNDAAPEVETPEVPESAPGDGIADIADLLGLAAQEPGSEEPKEGEKPAKTGEEKPAQGSQEQPKVVAPPQADDGAPKPKVEEPIPEKEGEKEQSLKDVLKEVLAETREAPKPEAPKKEEASKPQYAPQVPPELMEAIASEDPATRQAGMNALIGGAMSRVYADLDKLITARVQSALAMVPQVIERQTQVKQEAESLHKTFYEDNPNFGTSPKRKQFVAMAALQLAQSMGKDYKGPTPEFRAQLAKNIEEMTGLKAGKVAAPPQKEVKQVPAKPQFQTGGASTRAGDAVPTLSDDILETIGTLVN